MSAAFEVEGLARSFGVGRRRVDALVDVSFSVERGSIVALLGSNGAGKTTLTKILSTLLLPTAGRACVLGHDVVRETAAARARTTVIFGGDRGLYTRLSGRENLRFFGMLAGVGRRDLRSRLSGALEQVGLAEAADRRVETYSRGMRQRLHIAVGLIAEPLVLLLDEPTLGLDPVEADRLRLTVAGLRDRGATVLLTSHQLLDVERLADRVVMLAQGQVVGDLSLPDFVASAGYVAVIELRGRGAAPELGACLGAGLTVDRTQRSGNTWSTELRLQEWNAELFGAMALLLTGVEITDMRLRPARLDEAFAKLATPSGT